MKDSVSIGCSPACEDCAQAGELDYPSKARKECLAFIHQLKRQFGQEPDGARLFIKSNSHDFGIYYEVECYFDDSIPESMDYAFRLETESPEKWDKEAMKELKEEVKDILKDILTRDQQRQYSARKMIQAVNLELILRTLIQEALVGNLKSLEEFQQKIQFAPPEMKSRMSDFLDKSQQKETKNV